MNDPQWLSADEREGWLALVSIMFRLPGAIETQLRTEEDMSLAEYLVLAMLSETPGHRHRMSALAVATNTSQSRLSRIVARMEKAGLITREGRQDDRRVVIAEITPAGLERIREAAPGHVQRVREIVFSRLEPEQVEQLVAIGRALNRGSNKEGALGLRPMG